MKKGSLLGTAIITSLIIGLLFILTVTPVPKKIYEIFEKGEDACILSIRAQAALKLLDAKGFQTGLRCKSNDIELPYNLKSPTQQEHAKREIAEQMRKCWEKFGQGKLVLFTGEDLYCSVCSTITFTGKKENIENFNNYLENTNIPGKDLSYSAHLQAVQTQASAVKVSELPQQTQAVINSNDIYAVLFVYAKGADAKTKLEALAFHLFSDPIKYSIWTGRSPLDWFKTSFGLIKKVYSSRSAITILTPFNREALRELDCQFTKHQI